MKQVTGKNYAGRQVGLFYNETNNPVLIGDVTQSGTVTGGSAPHKSSSTGRVYVRKDEAKYMSEFFPTVINADWQELDESQQNKTFFKCYLRVRGIAPRCRKIDSHFVDLKGFQEVPVKLTDEVLQSIVSAAKTQLQTYKSVLSAEIKLSFTTLEGVFEQTELFDSRHQSIPLT